MTDRELLEAAAQAAGIVGEYVENKRVVTDYGLDHFTGILVGPEECWNPLTDDADRYRLAGATGLTVNFASGNVYGQGLHVSTAGTGKPLAWCIVRAAAAMVQK